MKQKLEVVRNCVKRNETIVNWLQGGNVCILHSVFTFNIKTTFIQLAINKMKIYLIYRRGGCETIFLAKFVSCYVSMVLNYVTAPHFTDITTQSTSKI